MYTALYRAERPEIFDQIIGQDHIVRILKNQIWTETVSHAYLFCGTRGTGKTTTARVLAKAVNCLDQELSGRPCGTCANCQSIKEGTFMDVIEIDAASNNGVENIRELRESVKYPPAVGRKKVYIIDEVHMLSTGASNALLKTLEEPPENVIFILATTDPQKLPQTILSRCMRLDFKRVPEKVLIDHIARICDQKGVRASESALRLLAANADGSVRDGLSLLDQCLSGGDRVLDRDQIVEFLGTATEEFFLELTERVSVQDVSGALVLLDQVLRDGKDVKQLMKDWMGHYRSLLITKYVKNPEDMLNMSTENVERVQMQSQQLPLEEINNSIVTLSRTINDARYSTHPRLLLEVAIVSIATGLTEGTAAVQTTKKGKTQMVKPAAVTRPVQTPVPQQLQKAEEKDEASSEESALPQYDLEDVWNRIFEEGESLRGSFNLIRTGAYLGAIGEKEFKVIAQSEFIRTYVEQNQAEICALMEKRIGKKLKLVCRMADDEREEPAADQGMQELADQIQNTYNFGVPVQVK